MPIVMFDPSVTLLLSIKIWVSQTASHENLVKAFLRCVNDGPFSVQFLGEFFSDFVVVFGMLFSFCIGILNVIRARG